MLLDKDETKNTTTVTEHDEDLTGENGNSCCSHSVQTSHDEADSCISKRLTFLNLSWWLILAVRCYQLTLSPLIGNCCRFTPSCSQYYIEAVRKYGPFKGTLKGIWRILRCNPYNKGGYDPP